MTDRLTKASSRKPAKKSGIKPVVRMSDLVPTTWLDPLLTGPSSAFAGKPSGTWGCREIEALLRGVQDRIRAQEQK
jgi:hypothetical protein